MRETRDFDIKWSQWHTLLFEEQVVEDMRAVCPQDVKQVLLKRARMVYWKKWAAKHEYEELKEVVWLEPIQVVLRRKTNESWTDKHRNVTRKLVVDVHRTPNPHALSCSRTRDFSRAVFHSLSCQRLSHA